MKGKQAPRKRRGAVWFLLLFLALVLGLDALVGDRGVFALMQARREHRALAAALAQVRAENARLREEARRLREEPSAIEELARRNLGLIKPGETLFIVKDVRATKLPPR
ncbi:MAG: septum formation initiator family protein [Chloroflexi bacterium]|nr:septum formation initiator family protein [Chloroflexota bacterium]MBE3134656.1 septum formation initiator family protein [Acidobacteriota bacterium]